MQDVAFGEYSKRSEIMRPSSARRRVRSGFSNNKPLFSTLAALTILPAGFNLALPGTASGAAWATPFEIIHGVFIHNVMTILWLFIALTLLSAGGLRASIPVRARYYAGLIALLGIVGFVSTLVNGAEFSTWPDLGEGGRLLLSSFYFLLMLYWATKNGPGFIMRWYLAGIAIGGLVNIYFSLTNPYNFVGVLPFLYSRNGGGGILALGIALGAWMWSIRDTLSRIDRVVSIGVSLVGIVAVAMSFSKTAMLIGTLGFLTWLVVLNASLLKIMRTKYGIGLLIATSVMLIAIPSKIISALDSLNESIQTKFAVGSSIDEDESAGDRWSYYLAAVEILGDDPMNSIIGVGYSGFYPTVVKTNTYKSGLVEEDSEAGKASNPHNSILYYLIANGVFGLVMITGLYLMFIQAIFRSIRGSRVIAYAITAGIAAVYICYGNALPSLFKTEVLYLPAAAAMSLIDVRRRSAS